MTVLSMSSDEFEAISIPNGAVTTGLGLVTYPPRYADDVRKRSLSREDLGSEFAEWADVSADWAGASLQLAAETWPTK